MGSLGVGSKVVWLVMSTSNILRHKHGVGVGIASKTIPIIYTCFGHIHNL